MKTILPLYLVGFMIGVVLGVLFSIPISAWIIVLSGALLIVIVTEAVGSWGFGGRWREYRVGVYVIWPAVVAFTLLGFLFGTGSMGRLLIAVGTLIS
jgi:hypothetical protein